MSDIRLRKRAPPPNGRVGTRPARPDPTGMVDRGAVCARRLVHTAGVRGVRVCGAGRRAAIAPVLAQKVHIKYCIIAREGRPLAMTEDISAVRLMTEIDKKGDLSANLDKLRIAMSQVHKILHDYVAVSKLCTRWLPYNLTEV
ncbi:hypothetical protein EVAR_103963_1 [Eumeta japonica]|uniref:Uncharacterized protein n=1 Tax=Eumeta variegata TaxID=151549 RepID=A0A4C1YBJ0_EUMVA|nr:hypothetical protein EVAR_103963_1 [Eumeta japonica]